MLVVGASATGVQIADELARAGREVVLAVGRHSRVPRRYRGMDIWWWLDQIGTFATDHRRRERPDPSRATKARCSSSAATTTATSTFPRSSGSGSASPAGSPASTVTHLTFADDLRDTTAAADERLAPAAGPHRRPHRRHRPRPARSSPPTRPPDCAPTEPITRLHARRDGIAVGRLGHGLPPLPTRGCGSRSSTPHGEIVQRRGVTPVAGLYVVGQRVPAPTRLELHRRRAPRRLLRRPPHRRPRRPPPHRAIAESRGRAMTEPLPRHDVVVVGARAAGAATAMLLARAGLDVLVVDRSRYGSDTLSTHALMRTGVVQLHRWGLLDDIIAAGTPAVRTTTFTFADEEVRITIKPSHGVDALYAPRRTVLDPILVDAARAAGASFDYGTTITDVVRDRTGRVVGVAGRDRRGRAVRHTARWIVGADGLRSVVADAVGSPIERRGTGATAVVYGYWSGLVTDGYHWIFRPEACAGLIPTNGDRTCVFAASTPARSRPGRPGRAPCTIVRAAEPEPRGRARLGHATQRRADVRRAARLHASAVGTGLGARRRCRRTGRTRSVRTGSPTRSATPRSSPGRSSPITRGGATEADALDHYHRTRNRLSLPLFDVVDTIAAMRWTRCRDPGAAPAAQLDHERRGRVRRQVRRRTSRQRSTAVTAFPSTDPPRRHAARSAEQPALHPPLRRSLQRPFRRRRRHQPAAPSRASGA